MIVVYIALGIALFCVGKFVLALLWEWMGESDAWIGPLIWIVIIGVAALVMRQ